MQEDVNEPNPAAIDCLAMVGIAILTASKSAGDFIHGIPVSEWYALALVGTVCVSAWARIAHEMGDERPFTWRLFSRNLSACILAAITSISLAYIWSGPHPALFAAAGFGGYFADRILTGAGEFIQAFWQTLKDRVGSLVTSLLDWIIRTPKR